MTTRPQPHTPYNRELAAERDVTRAEGDYRRLRVAYLDLAKGKENVVALAMVGADMERSHSLLESLRGLRQPFTPEQDKAIKRETRRLAEANA